MYTFMGKSSPNIVASGKSTCLALSIISLSLHFTDDFALLHVPKVTFRL